MVVVFGDEVGRCWTIGRRFVCSLCMGIESVVKLAENNSATSKYHLHGFNRASREVRRFLGIAACMARVPEAFVTELMEDDRLLLRSQECWQEMMDELMYLLGAPEHVWNTIAPRLHCEPGEFRHEVMSATVTSIAFVWLRIQTLLDEEHWCYTQGDIEGNVLRLSRMPPSTDPTTKKMQTLLAMGNHLDVVAALKCLRQSSMTTTLCEQAHASAAQVMRRHQQYGAELMCARACLHSARSWFQISKEERQEAHMTAMMEAKSKALAKTKPCDSRHAFVKELVNAGKKQIDGRVSDYTVRKAAFQHHGKHFKELDPEALQKLSARASQMDAAKKQKLEAECVFWEGQLDCWQYNRRNRTPSTGTPHTMASIASDDDNMNEFAAAWASYKANDCVGKLKPPPQAPNIEVQNKILDGASCHYDEPKDMPAWIRKVVKHRDEFQDCAFCVDEGESPHVMYKLVLAIQNPQEAVFLEVSRRPLTLPSFESGGTLQPGDMFLNKYDFLTLKFYTDQTLPIAQADDIVVADEVKFIGDYLVDGGNHTLFEEYALHLPDVPAARPKTQGDRKIRATRRSLRSRRSCHGSLKRRLRICWG